MLDTLKQRAYFAVKSAISKLSAWRRRFACDLNGAAAKRPQNRGYSRPCCDPSVVELQIRRSLGPVQTLLREFEFKHWGATITLTGFNLSQPGRIRVRYRRRRRLQKYVCGTTCTWQLRQTRDHENITFINSYNLVWRNDGVVVLLKPWESVHVLSELVGGKSAQTNANVRTWILDATDESPKGRNSCLALNTFSKKCVKDSKELFWIVKSAASFQLLLVSASTGGFPIARCSLCVETS